MGRIRSVLAVCSELDRFHAASDRMSAHRCHLWSGSHRTVGVRSDGLDLVGGSRPRTSSKGIRLRPSHRFGFSCAGSRRSAQRSRRTQWPLRTSAAFGAMMRDVERSHNLLGRSLLCATLSAISWICLQLERKRGRESPPNLHSIPSFVMKSSSCPVFTFLSQVGESSRREKRAS